jgi:hypothetical protein
MLQCFGGGVANMIPKQAALDTVKKSHLAVGCSEINSRHSQVVTPVQVYHRDLEVEIQATLFKTCRFVWKAIL